MDLIYQQWDSFILRLLMTILTIFSYRCTHAAHAYHAGITTMLVAKISTALISLITAAAMLIVIPGFVTFLEYTKSLEENIRLVQVLGFFLEKIVIRFSLL